MHCQKTVQGKAKEKKGNAQVVLNINKKRKGVNVDDTDQKRKAAIGTLDVPHSNFVLDKEFLPSSGEFYHKDRLIYLMEKVL